MINIKYTKSKCCEYCKAVNNLEWGYMSDGMPYGIQQQRLMHGHALLKYTLFTVADNIQLYVVGKINRLYHHSQFFVRKVLPYTHQTNIHLQLQINGRSLQRRAGRQTNFVLYKLYLQEIRQSNQQPLASAFRRSANKKALPAAAGRALIV